MFAEYSESTIFATAKRRMSDGVIGNTSDSGSEESRFEPWSDNKEGLTRVRSFFVSPEVEMTRRRLFVLVV